MCEHTDLNIPKYSSQDTKAKEMLSNVKRSTYFFLILHFYIGLCIDCLSHKFFAYLLS